MTEADWRASTTLVRFDTAYHTAFMCKLRRLAEHAPLPAFLRELYQWPGIAETVKLGEIKQGYWHLADSGGAVPIGPELDLEAPHGREHLSGRGIFERAR